jgi:ADP-ribosylglycohydrolase
MIFTPLSSASNDMDFLSLHPFVRSTAQDKIFGTILGSALGDTIGLYTEFLPATLAANCYPDGKFTLQPPTPIRGDSHRDRFDVAAWTDDTDHSLLIILSYLHNNGEILPNDFAARLAIWVNQGLRCLDRPPLGIGQTIATIATKPEFADSPFEVALATWIKTGRRNAANGSLMRTHPLGVMCVGFALEDTLWTAAHMSRTTHVDPRCVVSCCVSSALIRGILRGEIESEDDVNTLIQQTFDWVFAQDTLRNPEHGKELHAGFIQVESDNSGDFLDADEFKRHVNAQSFDELELDDSQKMGYVYKCLGSAVLSLRLAMRDKRPKTNTFETLITDLIMRGGDTDTNATAAGALLGAWLGFSRLPAHWADGIKHREWLMQKTENLSRLVGVSPHGREPDPKVDPDTEMYGGKEPMTGEDIRKMEAELMTRLIEKDRQRKKEEEESKNSSSKKKKGFGKWLGSS